MTSTERDSGAGAGVGFWSLCRQDSQAPSA